MLVWVDSQKRTNTTSLNLCFQARIKSVTMIFSLIDHDELDIQNLSQQSNAPEARWRHAAVTYIVDNKDFVLITGKLIMMMLSTVAQFLWRKYHCVLDMSLAVFL